MRRCWSGWVCLLRAKTQHHRGEGVNPPPPKRSPAPSRSVHGLPPLLPTLHKVAGHVPDRPSSKSKKTAAVVPANDAAPHYTTPFRCGDAVLAYVADGMYFPGTIQDIDESRHADILSVLFAFSPINPCSEATRWLMPGYKGVVADTIPRPEVSGPPFVSPQTIAGAGKRVCFWQCRVLSAGKRMSCSQGKRPRAGET